VIDLLGLLMERDLTTDEVTLNYGFDARQTRYYADAARYLGLVLFDSQRTPQGSRETVIRLTDRGRTIMGMPYQPKYLALVGALLEHRPFADALALSLKQSKLPSMDEVVRVMRGTVRGAKADSTLRRRAQTVRRWLDWIFALTEASTRATSD
jgi:hypothetical protein